MNFSDRWDKLERDEDSLRISYRAMKEIRLYYKLVRFMNHVYLYVIVFLMISVAVSKIIGTTFFHGPVFALLMIVPSVVVIALCYATLFLYIKNRRFFKGGWWSDDGDDDGDEDPPTESPSPHILQRK